MQTCQLYLFSHDVKFTFTFIVFVKIFFRLFVKESVSSAYTRSDMVWRLQRATS